MVDKFFKEQSPQADFNSPPPGKCNDFLSNEKTRIDYDLYGQIISKKEKAVDET